MSAAHHANFTAADSTLTTPYERTRAHDFAPGKDASRGWGVSLGSRTLKLQRLQFQQPWVKKQSSHVCSQNTE